MTETLKILKLGLLNAPRAIKITGNHFFSSASCELIMTPFCLSHPMEGNECWPHKCR